MKKLMFGMAAALALCGMAIESSNIVGYVDRTEVKGGIWQIMPCQFETTESVEIDLQAYVKGSFTKTVSYYDSGWQANAPEIQIRNPQTGKTTHYYYLADAYIEDSDSESEGWADDNGNFVASVKLDAGSGFWFKSNTDCDVIFAGQVVSEETCELKVYPIWTLIGNSYPQGFALNSITWQGIDATHSYEDADWTSTAPEVQVRDTVTGKTTHYYYLSDAYLVADDDVCAGWADDNGNFVSTDTVIPAGVGFWFRPTAEMNVQFAR